MVLPQLAHDCDCFIEFWVNARGNWWSPVFIIWGRRGGSACGWEGG